MVYVIRNGEMVERVMRWLRKIADGGFEKLWQIEITRYSKKNSNNQKRTYFGWCDLIADETGHTKDEIDELFRKKFLPTVVVELGGETHEVSASIRKLPTMQMSELMGKVQAFCDTDLGILLPTPNDGGDWAIREQE